MHQYHEHQWNRLGWLNDTPHTYRVVQKSCCQVARKVQPGYSQARPAKPGWCLPKQSLFYAQCQNAYNLHNRRYRLCPVYNNPNIRDSAVCVSYSLPSQWVPHFEKSSKQLHGRYSTPWTHLDSAYNVVLEVASVVDHLLGLNGSCCSAHQSRGTWVPIKRKHIT